MSLQLFEEKCGQRYRCGAGAALVEPVTTHLLRCHVALLALNRRDVLLLFGR